MGLPWDWGRFSEDQGCGSVWQSQRREIKGALRSMFIQQAQRFKNQTSAELSRQVTKIKQEKGGVGQGAGPRLGGLGAPGAGRERQV